MRVNGGLGSRGLGGLRGLLRLGKALVAEQQLRVRVGQTIHRKKRRGGGHVHVVLEGHNRGIGSVVIFAVGFPVQPAHGDELQLQFANANGGGVGADRAVVRLRGRAGAGVDGDCVVVQILEGGRAADAVHGQTRLVVLVHVGLEGLHGGGGGRVIAARRRFGVQPAQLDQLPLQAGDFRARGVLVHNAAVRHRGGRRGDCFYGLSPRIVDVLLHVAPRIVDGARGANRRLRGSHAFAGLLRHPVVVDGVDGLNRVARGIGRGGRRGLRVIGRLVGHQRQGRVGNGAVGRGGRAGADGDDHAHDDQHHGDAHHNQHHGQALEQAALLVVVASVVCRGGRFRGRRFNLALDEIARAVHAHKDVFPVCVLAVFGVQAHALQRLVEGRFVAGQRLHGAVRAAGGVLGREKLAHAAANVLFQIQHVVYDAGLILPAGAADEEAVGNHRSGRQAVRVLGCVLLIAAVRADRRTVQLMKAVHAKAGVVFHDESLRIRRPLRRPSVD